MKLQTIIVMLLVMGIVFAAFGDPTKFGYNNTTTVTLGGLTGNGTFNGTVSARGFLGDINASYVKNVSWAGTGSCAANQFGIAATTSGVACAQAASANLSDSANIPLKNTANTFTANQTFSANITVGASAGRIALGNGGYIDFNSTCTMTCFNATICSKIGPGC